MYQLAIFDLDGTLLDTLPDLCDSVNKALCQFEMPPRTLEEVRTFVGTGTDNLIRKAVPAGTSAETTAEVTKFYRAWYGEHYNVKTKPYTHMREILFAMRAGGCRIAVLTNKMEDVAQELCDTHFEFLPDMIVRGQKPGMPLKPDPTPVLAIMEEVGFDWDQTFYIGDSEVDVETARNANIKCISCTWGFRTREQLLEAGAEHIIDSPLSLMEEMLQGGVAPSSLADVAVLPQ